MNKLLCDGLALLSSPHSPKRRAGAKNLRKLADVVAGPVLLDALRRELKDVRTWETQYQMVMAIGHCNYVDAIPFLESLIEQKLGGMVDIALGDALLRLSRRHDNDAKRCVDFIDAQQKLSTIGAMQAIAVLRMVPDFPTLRRLVDYGTALELGENDSAVTWLLRATPGWPEEHVNPLLEKWGVVPFLKQQQIFNSVDLARKRKYAKWTTL